MRTKTLVNLLCCLLPAMASAVQPLSQPPGPVIPEGILKGCQLNSGNQMYPRNLKAQKVTGQVLTELEIGNNGRPANIVILSSKPEGAFDAAAKDWFSNLRCPRGRVPDGRFKFLLVYNLPDNLGDPIDATLESWVVTAR